jgi:multiple antibiotic resistance protein
MLRDLLETVLATFAGLLPIANPFSTAVVFLALTRNFSDESKKRQARLAAWYMALVLWSFLFAGALIMGFFGISIPALRIAGGLIVARIGFGMLSDPGESEPERAPRAGAEIAFTPLAVPMLSGPGSIAVTIGMAAGARSWLQHLAIAVGIALVAFLSYWVVREAPRVSSLLGVQGLDALTRILGFLLVCVGVQFIGVAVGEVLSNPGFVTPILEAIRGAGG